jgi:hypothetical protein
MAIGPTGLPVLPPLDGQRGAVAGATERRIDARASRAGAERPQGTAQETAIAELLDDADRRQVDLEATADQVRQLNPNAPRGSILNIIV